jgi:hypothetical protein
VQFVEVYLQIRQPHDRVGADLVEVVHQHRFGKHGQLTQRRIPEPMVEAPIERRVRGGECPHLRQLPPLVIFQLGLGPSLPLTQGSPQPQDSRDHRQVHPHSFASLSQSPMASPGPISANGVSWAHPAECRSY